MRKYNISDAVAYLLEKAGDIQGAFGIMRESLKNKIKGIEETAEKGEGNNSCPGSIYILEITGIMLRISQTYSGAIFPVFVRKFCDFSCIYTDVLKEDRKLWNMIFSLKKIDFDCVKVE